METFASFRVDQGRLAGVTHLPDAARPPGGFACVVMLHDFLGDRSGEGRLLTLGARFLQAGGVAALRFDHRGNGDSEGDHGAVTPSALVQDALAAVEYARGLPEIDAERVALLGYGLGGMTAALAAREARAHRVALWAPMLPQDLLRRLPSGALGQPLVDAYGQGVGRALMNELPLLDPPRSLAEAHVDTHVFHAERDAAAPPGSAEAYARAAGAPLSTVPMVGHAFERIPAREALFQGTVAFLRGGV